MVLLYIIFIFMKCFHKKKIAREREGSEIYFFLLFPHPFFFSSTFQARRRDDEDETLFKKKTHSFMFLPVLFFALLMYTHV